MRVELHAHTTWSDGELSSRELIDLYGRSGFDWIAQRQMPWVATGDFHRPEHLFSWKTLLDCERTEAAVVGALRSARQFPLMRIGVGRAAA